MITITVDDRAIRKAFAAAPVLLARELSGEVRRFVVNGTSDFQKANLRAKDDRNRGPASHEDDSLTVLAD